MRTIIILLVLAPFISNGQINRSATEVAKEVTKNWLLKKAFKGKKYQPISFSDLKAKDDRVSGTAWTIEHIFQIQDRSGFDPSSTGARTYSFLFYLDKRMNVIKAEAYSRDQQ